MVQNREDARMIPFGVPMPKMKVYLWQMDTASTLDWDDIVLWDGHNTYWCEVMHASGGYKQMREEWSTIGTRFVYIGEL